MTLNKQYSSYQSVCTLHITLTTVWQDFGIEKNIK